MAESLLDRAARVRQMKIEVDELIGQIRRDGADWTMLAVAADEAMEIAEVGLRQCYQTLDNIRRIARPSKPLPTPPQERE